MDLDSVERQSESVGRYDGQHRASAYAEALRAHLHFDRAVGMDCQIAIAGVPAALPGVDRKSEPAFDGLRGAGRAFAARAPELLPFDHFRRFRQFVAVYVGARAGQVKVL